MKQLRTYLLSTLLLAQLLTSQAQTTPSPYELRTGREVIWLGAGAATWWASLALGQGLVPLDLATVRTLNRQDVNAFDRGATYRWSPTATQLSDVTLAGAVGTVGVVILTPAVRQDWKTIGLMYIETFVLANGLKQSVKNLTARNRPFTYNPNVDPADKLTKDARQSFFSGHTSDAFASAVFASEVFRHYYPHSRWKPVVWIGSLGLATATALFRYEGGKHYPTDLIAGAAVGSLVGWGIPKLHEIKTRNTALRQLDVQPWSTGQASGLRVRWTFSSAKFVTR